VSVIIVAVLLVRVRATDVPLYHPVMASQVFALSVHADYACRHAGACCTAGWSIPVEPASRRILRVDVLTPAPDCACPEYDAAQRLCRVHRDHGEAMLPESCYEFPRRALADARGTFVSLTHFCPTAASQLFRTDVELSIVENPPAFPGHRHYDPLDGRGEWPPLVRPTVLFDLESYTRWERFIVSTFARDQPVPAALEAVAEAGEVIRTWAPSCGSLAAHVEAAACLPRAGGASNASAMYHRFAAPAGYALIVHTMPHGLTRPTVPADVSAALADSVDPLWTRFSTPVRRYLAVKAFGSWSAYQGRGLRTLVAELFASEMVVRVEAARACHAAAKPLDVPLLHEAIRQADWLLMHAADRMQLLRWFGEVEDQ
jgi:hypothetical protein